MQPNPISRPGTLHGEMVDAVLGGGVGAYLIDGDTPLEVCEARDPKGLFRRARAGTLIGLTGVDDPYEPPPHPDLVLDGTRPIGEGVSSLESLLGERGRL